VGAEKESSSIKPRYILMIKRNTNTERRDLSFFHRQMIQISVPSKAGATAIRKPAVV
jgi:hypothetical protein